MRSIVDRVVPFLCVGIVVCCGIAALADPDAKAPPPSLDAISAPAAPVSPPALVPPEPAAVLVAQPPSQPPVPAEVSPAAVPNPLPDPVLDAITPVLEPPPARGFAPWAAYAQLALAFAIVALIRLVQMRWKEIPKGWLPWVSAVLGVAGSALVALQDGAVFSGEDAVAILLNGIVAGWAGSGAWSGLAKHIIPVKKAPN